eukprot:CAMPEP_0113945266 /NCGR_PEP_ID=MMETSP1339-20121228/42869_1 /TAXON_ID=94617 /ORGANISM="Fibrocapsa japonica" /LENGTH=69 /DNA_ID=CAMNT_0000950759 /DNA_START=65 /DNA_END=271 /DNA_ORIENTATION=- /assembly_acc=CAM_ASM_000762
MGRSKRKHKKSRDRSGSRDRSRSDSRDRREYDSDEDSRPKRMSRFSSGPVDPATMMAMQQGSVGGYGGG